VRGAALGTDDAGVLEAARAIRPYLTELVGPAAADRLDRHLADLLTGAPDEPNTIVTLRALLDEHKDTRWFLTEALADAPQYRPPYQQPRYLRPRRGSPSPAGSSSLAGDPAFISAPRYSCPYGDYVVWYEPEVDSPIPDCQTHHVPLTRP
jgi:hypothetical protein